VFKPPRAEEKTDNAASLFLIAPRKSLDGEITARADPVAATKSRLIPIDLKVGDPSDSANGRAPRVKGSPPNF